MHVKTAEAKLLAQKTHRVKRLLGEIATLAFDDEEDARTVREGAAFVIDELFSQLLVPLAIAFPETVPKSDAEDMELDRPAREFRRNRSDGM